MKHKALLSLCVRFHYLNCCAFLLLIPQLMWNLLLYCSTENFQVLLLGETHYTSSLETRITGLMVKANKSPKAPFLESYEDMLLYSQREETWLFTKMELEGRGVAWIWTSSTACSLTQIYTDTDSGYKQTTHSLKSGVRSRSDGMAVTVVSYYWTDTKIRGLSCAA